MNLDKQVVSFQIEKAIFIMKNSVSLFLGALFVRMKLMKFSYAKNIKHLMGRIVVCLIPLVVMAITFALISWEEIASIGMILFWSLIIMLIYNVLVLELRLLKKCK